VMVTNIDEAGKIRLSRQAVLEGWTVEQAVERDRGARSGARSERGGRGESPRGSEREPRSREDMRSRGGGRGGARPRR